MRLAVISLLLSLPLGAQALSWEQIRQLPDFQNARDALGQSLPELAIPRFKKLLLQDGLDATAKASLLALLGEAEVRDGRFSEAVETLNDPVLREFSPAHLWRSRALAQLGQYRNAIAALGLIDRSSMLSEAHYETAVLEAALGNFQAASDFLVPLSKSQDADLALKSSLQLVSLHLQNGDLDLARKTLEKIAPETSEGDQGMLGYLRGRFYLAKGYRTAAVQSFQSLVNAPPGNLKLPGPLFHAATLSLADSLTLENNEAAGINSLLETLEKFPNSPRIVEIFARLDRWGALSETGKNTLRKKLEGWIPLAIDAPGADGVKEQPSSGGFAVSSTRRGAASRAIHALHLLATLNLRSPDPIQRALAIKQFAQLQTLAGSKNGALVADSFVQIGLSSLSEGNAPAALTHFELLRDFAETPILKATAFALIGKAMLVLEDAEKASAAYLEARKIAAEANLHELELTSAVNAGIALVAAGRGEDLEKIAGSLDNPDAAAALLLERGLNLVDQRDPKARLLLARFLGDYPGNPRHHEGTLALAESALYQPLDTALAKTRSASLKIEFFFKEPALAGRLLLVRLKLSQDGGQTAEFADKTTRQTSDFLDRLPDHPLSPRLLFELGQTYRQFGELGPANLSFEKFLERFPEHELADAARFLSALSAMAMSSAAESAEAGALASFQKLAAGQGPLATEAAIARAGLLIDSDRQAIALTEIGALLAREDLIESDRHRLLILAADASGQTGDYERAIAFYDTLLARPDLPIATANRAYFQRGRTFEQLGRQGEALESYLIVVNRRSKPGEAAKLEWEWFDRCGIEGALNLLEQAKRWEAAIKLCDRLARSGSPRADDAAASAERIGLEQMIPRKR